MTQQRDWDQFLNQARMQLIGSSDAGIKAETYDTLREFFNDTSCWTETINIPIQAGTLDYAVTPTGGQIIRLIGVLDTNNIAQPAVMPDFGTIHFAFPYNKSDTFTAILVKNVDLPTDKKMLPVMPDWVLPKWGYGILSGVVGHMQSHKGMVFSDPQLSIRNIKLFKDAIIRARTAALRANTFGTQRWMFPGGWRTRTQKGGITVGNDTRFQ